MSDYREPDAYGLLDEGEVHYATPFRDEAASVLRRTGDKDSSIVPLYRQPQPTLTDEERMAIEAIMVDPDSAPANSAATLRGLLERLGGVR